MNTSQTSKKIKEEEGNTPKTQPNSFYEAITALKPKSDKDKKATDHFS